MNFRDDIINDIINIKTLKISSTARKLMIKFDIQNCIYISK